VEFLTVALMAGALFAVIVGDAAWFADPLRVEISVPKKLADGGFTENAAKEVFVAQVGRIASVTSLVPMPRADMSSGPSVLAALAKPLELDEAVASLQEQVGRNVVRVDGVVMTAATAPRLDMVLIVNEPTEPPKQYRLSQDNGDPAALVMQGAGMALEDIAPYRVALTQFTQGLAGDDASFSLAKGTATRALSHAWDASLYYPDDALDGASLRSTQFAMLRNLLAVLALERGDAAEARQQLEMSQPIPHVWSGARSVIELNRAFLAVATKRPADAITYIDAGRKAAGAISQPGYASEIDTLAAVVAWADGDPAAADRLLRLSIAAAPHNEASHTYLGRLLAAKGDAQGAKAELATALAARHYDYQLRDLLQENFWVDPVTGDLTKRSAD
jgi:hypothetical protein